MMVSLIYSNNIIYIDNKTKMSSQKKFTNDDTMIDEDDNVDNKDHVMEDITREFSMSIVNKTTVCSKTVEKMRKIYLNKILWY